MTGKLEPYRPADAEDVARLHRHIYHGTADAPPARLVSYYRRIFFENPWYDETLPSMIFRTPDGTVCGFMGLIPRPWLFDAWAIKSVVGHRLMVPDSVPNAPLVAARLVRACLKAPHAFLINDASSDAGKRAVLAMGGVSVPQYSLRWVFPLKPLGYWREKAAQRPKLRALAVAGRPFAALADTVAARRTRVAACDHSVTHTALSTADLFASIELATRTMRLRPQHTLESLEWILAEMRADPWRPSLDGFSIRRDGRLIASCLFHTCPRGGIELDVIAGESPAADRQLLIGAIDVARKKGATHLFGRFEPRLAEPIWDLGCRLTPTPDCWTVAYARDAEITQQLEAGRVFLSNLDAELWLGVPHEYRE